MSALERMRAAADLASDGRERMPEHRAELRDVAASWAVISIAESLAKIAEDGVRVSDIKGTAIDKLWNSRSGR